ncbi:MAG: tetratricopeptide repeat protein [Vicingaceae bacterium]|nr:tetratricopeptide repeat protein [Vicingaceae bacterium]
MQNELKNPPNNFSKAKILLSISENCEINDIEFYANQLISLCDTILLKETNQLKIADLNSFKAQAYNSIGFMYKHQGISDKSIDNYFKGLKLAELAKDTLTIADICNNLGSAFLQQEDIENAITFSEKAFKLYAKTNNHEGVGIICNNLGDIYQKQKQFEKSLEYHTRSLSVWSKLDNLYFKAISFNNIGVILNKKGQAEKALANYKNSEEIFNMLKDSSNLAWTYNLIGRVYLENKKIDLAEEYLTNGYNLATKLGLIDLKKYLSQNLFFVYEGQKEYSKALKFYKEYIIINDSLKNESAQKSAIQQMAKYEYEKQKAVDDAEHEKEIAIEQEAKEKQTILTYATAGGLGLVGIFLLVVFNRLKVTRKQKNIIEEQKTEVEKQKTVVELAHTELEEKNKEITDSIQYAKRIQNAILPPNKVVKEYLQESFIYYKPKDIVAGDFYWLESVPRLGENENSKVLFAAADCTGHGVPGAMVSVVCNNGLNRSVREYGLTDPGEILNKTREIVVQEFEKSEEEVKDGMDIALCSLEGNKLQYAGAHNPLWIIRDGELIETKANKQPIGQFDNPEPYTTHTLELQKGDSIYIFSDGYADQFGGEKGKKLKTANFKKLLLSIQKESMEKQKQLIDEAFENWRGNLEQLDDVCVIGVRI